MGRVAAAAPADASLRLRREIDSQVLQLRRARENAEPWRTPAGDRVHAAPPAPARTFADTILDEDKLDLDTVTAVIEVKVTPQREGGFNSIAQRISKFPEVRSAYLMSGAYDLLLFVEGRNLREVATFVSEHLSPLEGVLSTSTHFMLKTYKRLGVLMQQDSSDERLSVSP